MFGRLAVITCTGERPEAIYLFQRWLSRQTWKGEIVWIVVDDGEVPCDLWLTGQYFNIQVMHIRARPYWKPGENTQQRNMNLALDRVPADCEAIAIMEDDELYEPDYLLMLLILLYSSGAVMVGEGRARYYNLPHRMFSYCANLYHASLCQTILRPPALPLLRQAVNSGNKFFDIELWKLAREAGLQTIVATETTQTVSPKGMPGRVGIGFGHAPGKEFKGDHNLEIFHEWFGENASFYQKHLGEKKWLKEVMTKVIGAWHGR